MIYEILRREIAEGFYVPGDLLPSENELCLRHGVTRPTVRKTLDMLTADGFIVRHRGKRSIVKGSPTPIGIMSLTGTTSAMDGTELHTDIIVAPEIRSWNEAFTYQISDAERQSGCIYFERLRILNGDPVILDITMLPNLLPRFIENDMHNASLFSLLRSKYNITVTGGVQHIQAITADRRLHAHLNVRQGHPILQLNRRINTDRDGFHIYSCLLCVTNKYVLTGTF